MRLKSSEAAVEAVVNATEISVGQPALQQIQNQKWPTIMLRRQASF